MDSIVLELQREAMSNTINTTDLLRKALFVARKLKVKKFEDWISLELNGYKMESSIPDYREVIGKVQWFNPYRGWCPLIIQNEEVAKVVSSRKIGQQISEIQSLMNGDHTSLVLLLPQGLQNVLSTNTGHVTEYQLSISKSQLEKIQDTVKNIIFEWALRLEEDGILGEDLSFSEKEKNEATKHNYNFNNFYGDASNIQIQQDVAKSNQTIATDTVDIEKISEFITKLNDNLIQVGLSKNQKDLVESEIKTIIKEIETAKPTSSNLKKSLDCIKTVLEGTGGSLVASGLIYMIEKLSI